MKYKILVFILLIIAFVISGFGINNQENLNIKINELFPYKIEEWEGLNSKVDDSVYTMLDKEELLIRNYKNKITGQNLNLAIVLTNKRDHIHDPEICYRGQGISMDEESKIKLNDKDLAVIVNGKRQKKPYKIVYWYTNHNKTFFSRVEFMQNIILSKLFNKKNKYFALVVITTPDFNNQDVELAKFSNNINLILKKILSD